jgi:hypothetical protein
MPRRNSWRQWVYRRGRLLGAGCLGGGRTACKCGGRAETTKLVYAAQAVLERACQATFRLLRLSCSYAPAQASGPEKPQVGGVSLERARFGTAPNSPLAIG